MKRDIQFECWQCDAVLRLLDMFGEGIYDMGMSIEGRLIEMNAHMMVTDGARRMIVFGALATAVFLFMLVWTIVGDGKHKVSTAITCVVMAALCAGLVAIGNSEPRVKEILFCADGPISLERLAAVYQIMEIDGKEIIVREKQ